MKITNISVNFDKTKDSNLRYEATVVVLEEGTRREKVRYASTPQAACYHAIGDLISDRRDELINSISIQTVAAF